MWGNRRNKNRNFERYSTRRTGYIPEEYKKPADHPGTLEKLTYETWESFSYEDHSQKLTKEVCVYLPYGYDENEKYNVFYLSHGGWTVYGRAGKTTGA